MLERCSPRYVPGVVVASRTEKKEHPGKPQNPTGSPMGKHQSDRIQVIGGGLLIGQWLPGSPGISDRDERTCIMRMVVKSRPSDQAGECTKIKSGQNDNCEDFITNQEH